MPLVADSRGRGMETGSKPKVRTMLGVSQDETQTMMVGKDVGAVVQAINVLRVLAAAREPLGVTAIARAAGVSPSTTLNILRTLVGQHLVAFSQSSKTYRLDYGLLELSRSLLNKSHVALLNSELQRLTNQYEATATVWQIQADRLLSLDRVVPESGIHIEFPVATRNPLYVGALGRLIVALTNPPREVLEAAFVRIRWNEPISFERYLQEVDEAKARGYGVDAGTTIRSVTSVAAVISDQQGKPRLGISAHTFLGQLSPASIERLGEDLKALAARAHRAFYGA